MPCVRTWTPALHGKPAWQLREENGKFAYRPHTRTHNATKWIENGRSENRLPDAARWLMDAKLLHQVDGRICLLLQPKMPFGAGRQCNATTVWGSPSPMDTKARALVKLPIPVPAALWHATLEVGSYCSPAVGSHPLPPCPSHRGGFPTLCPQQLCICSPRPH